MTQYYETITPPSATVISLADAKAFLRVETSADDALIGALIEAAIDSAEKYTNRTLRPTDFRVSQIGGSCIKLLKSPVTGSPTVESWNEDTDAFEALTGTLYYPSNFFPSISLPARVAGPSDSPFGVRASFTAGYASGQVPAAILQGLKAHINFLYENRGDAEAIGNVKIPEISKMLYRQYRIIATYG